MLAARPSAAAESIHGDQGPSTEGGKAPFVQLRAFRAATTANCEQPERLDGWEGDAWPAAGSLRFVLFTLIGLADRSGVVRATMRHDRRRAPRLYEILRERTGLHRTTIRRCLQALEHHGHIARWNGQLQWNVAYIIRLGQDPRSAADDSTAGYSTRAMHLVMELEQEIERAEFERAAEVRR